MFRSTFIIGMTVISRLIVLYGKKSANSQKGYSQKGYCRLEKFDHRKV
jgi:hypothetical protein